jgi:hypothetical protein
MRKAISKKLRFEVFKRDSFTCQYCGQSAPNVVLHIDHIHPVSKGGKNTILNLITSCLACNQGKRDTLLNDDTALVKQQKQMEAMQERANQIKMMAQWQKDILKHEDDLIDIIDSKISDLFGYSLSDRGRVTMRKNIKNFGIDEVLNAIDIAYDRYYYGDDNSAKMAMMKVGGICYNRKIEGRHVNGYL